MSDPDFNEFLLESIMEKKDLLPGGLADNAPTSDFDPEQLKMGVEAELEHTSNREMAEEIAKDHLKEDPKYYTKLKKMEESKSITEKSHWDQRKSSSGKKAVGKEYSQHKKTRNATGAAREQDKRKRNTKRGSQQAAARDKIRREVEQGKKKRPSTCPRCGSKPGSTSNGLSNMIWDHTEGYSDAGHSKGQWLCRTCHNKKDNNKSGDKSSKNKRRSSGLGSIGKDSGKAEMAKTESRKGSMFSLCEGLNKGQKKRK
jgi:hypothetical protein